MKLIKAIIQPFMLDNVIDALRARPTLPGATISEVLGMGRSSSADSTDQTASIGCYAFAKKTKLDLVVADADAQAVVDLIANAARTGQPGDGVVFISDVRHAVYVRTGKEMSRGSSEEIHE